MSYSRHLFRIVLSVLFFATIAISTCADSAVGDPSTETDCLTRDPSTIIKAGDTYWVYGTGRGVSQFSSTDKFHWTYRGPVFANTPGWVAQVVPQNRRGDAWAPDVRFFNGTYYLYYSYSSFGRKDSGIGVATNKSLDPKGWTDQGVVISSGSKTDFNTIDPCIFVDSTVAPWLSFGSYFSGIKIIKIDPTTGKQSSTDHNIYPVAEHPQSAANSIEASSVHYHDGYYYLFVNWDSCCAGVRSTYNIRVGRSATVTGPYLDKSGKDMMLGGGSLFLGSNPDYGGGLPYDDEVGPGHAGIIEDTDGCWFSCHYEAARDKGGATTLNVMKLTWGADGWPSVPVISQPHSVPGGLVVKLQNENSGLHLYGAGSELLQQTDDGTKGEVWRLDAVRDGFYTLTNVDNNLMLASVKGSQPGEKVDLEAANSSDYVLWKAETTDGGYFNLSNKGSGLCLDDPGASKDPGHAIAQWTPNDLAPEHWRFEVQADDRGIVSGAQYKLVNAATLLCVDDPEGSHDAGQAIGVWTDNGFGPQRWRLEWVRGANYRIVSGQSGLCLSSTGLAGSEKGGVFQMKTDGSSSQLWKFVRGLGGKCSFENEKSGAKLGAQNMAGAKLTLDAGVGVNCDWILVRE